MADSIVSQFRREYALPIETTRQVSTISQRDAISTLRRWEGMLVYVVTEGVTYILQGGTDNTSWISLVGLSDAPVDGQSYVRKEGNWNLLPNILPDAPEDGETYGRKDGNWSVVSAGLPDAPSDGDLYGRKDGAWSIVSSGIPDAPTDGTLYGREDGAWAAVPIIPTLDLVEDSTVTGSYNLDWNNSTWNLTLTGTTTLTQTNLPVTGQTKTITIYVTGNFVLTLPSGWTDNISGAYIGTANNQIVVEYIKSGVYWVTINQAD